MEIFALLLCAPHPQTHTQANKILIKTLPIKCIHEEHFSIRHSNRSTVVSKPIAMFSVIFLSHLLLIWAVDEVSPEIRLIEWLWSYLCSDNIQNALVLDMADRTLVFVVGVAIEATVGKRKVFLFRCESNSIGMDKAMAGWGTYCWWKECRHRKWIEGRSSGWLQTLHLEPWKTRAPVLIWSICWRTALVSWR